MMEIVNVNKGNGAGGKNTNNYDILMNDGYQQVPMCKNGICVLFGCDENYFQMFDEWFNNSL